MEHMRMESSPGTSFQFEEACLVVWDAQKLSTHALNHRRYQTLI